MDDQPVKGHSNTRSRVIALSIVFLAIVGITLVEIGPLRPGAKNSETAPDAIDRELSKLVKPAPGLQHPRTRAREAEAAIARGDFAQASAIVTAMSDASTLYWDFYPFDQFMANLLPHESETLQHQLDAWVKAEASSPVPYFVRAQYYYNAGWAARGESPAAYISAARMDAYDVYMKHGLKDIDTAQAHGLRNPYLDVLRLHLLLNHGNTPAIDDAFKKAILLNPGYVELYRTRLRTLMPKWGGSVEAMKQFTQTYAGDAPNGSPLKSLYVRLYANLLDTASLACVGPHDTVQTRKACIQATLKQYNIDTAAKQLDEAFALFKNADPITFARTFAPSFENMMTTWGVEPQALDALQRLAMATGSNTEMTPTGTAANYYLVDAMTGLYWRQQGNIGNAVQKYLWAAHQIMPPGATPTAPVEEALADVYENLASIARQQKNYAGAIAYSRAAAGLNGTIAYNCYAEYMLGMFPKAIASCSADYADHGDYHTLYVRALAYRQLGDLDHMLADYTAVADAKGDDYSLKSRAASEVTVMYGNRGDVAGQLAFLEQHAYLFDANLMEPEDLAVHYNNRCYAKMQLKRLHEALDDCNISLKYGNVPDAVAKKAQLERMLK